MKDLNVLLAGFGGQGILFMGKLIAYAGLIDGREVSWLPSYGPEMRGGTANCSVCLSDEPVCSPLVTEPDILIVMNQPSFDRFIGSVAPGGIAIIDSSLVGGKTAREDISSFYVPATALAGEKGLQCLANIILVGKMLAETRFCSLDTMRAAIEKAVPPRKQNLVAGNMRAVELGMDS